MKLDRFLRIFLLVTLGLTLPNLLHAQTPPATTYQPGPWQPVARVDIGRPVQIKIVNQTDISLDYDLSANINASPQQIQPGESTTLTGFVIPAYILINRSDAASNRFSDSVIFAVEVNKDNIVTVTVTKVGSDTPGYTTFNLDRKGAIYIY
jgi:hypothetical protein